MELPQKMKDGYRLGGAHDVRLAEHRYQTDMHKGHLKSPMIDFNKLADFAYNRSTLKSSERSDLMNLWSAFFKLEKWLFIVDASGAGLDTNPFVGYIDEKPWFFAFTDSERALGFAKKYKLTDKSGECLYVALNPENALQMLTSAQVTIEGLRINEGPHGWFSPPVGNVGQIYSLLQEEKRL